MRNQLGRRKSATPAYALKRSLEDAEDVERVTVWDRGQSREFTPEQVKAGDADKWTRRA